MTDWLIENKEWIFSGIGVFILSGIFMLIRYIFFSKKKISESTRTINFNGEKGTYVEKNEGEIKIN